MIGVIIPAHNEALLLGNCLDSILAASVHEGLLGEAVRITVVLDSCTDGTATVAHRAGVSTVRVDARNVGIARDAGARRLAAQGARWLAFTDADSRVAPDWLVAQLALGADAVCGSVQIDDWQVHPASLRDTWCSRYKDADGHRHVHGANLGASALAYELAGGFPPLACSEDVAFVESLTAAGMTIAWSAAPRVTTSSRLHARVRGGFGDTLARWAQESLINDRSPPPLEAAAVSREEGILPAVSGRCTPIAT